MITLMQNRSVGPQALVTDVLSARRTVRISFHRTDETHSVDVVRGDEVLRLLASGLRDELVVERLAAAYATALGLDVTRIDTA